MKRGHGREGSACRAAWLKLMGQGKGAMENGHPTWPPGHLITPTHTWTRVRTRSTPSPLFNLDPSNDQWIRLPEAIYLVSPTAGHSCFSPLCILRGWWHLIDFQPSVNWAASAKRMMNECLIIRLHEVRITKIYPLRTKGFRVSLLIFFYQTSAAAVRTQRNMCFVIKLHFSASWLKRATSASSCCWSNFLELQCAIFTGIYWHKIEYTFICKVK